MGRFWRYQTNHIHGPRMWPIAYTFSSVRLPKVGHSKQEGGCDGLSHAYRATTSSYNTLCDSPTAPLGDVPSFRLIQHMAGHNRLVNIVSPHSSLNWLHFCSAQTTQSCTADSMWLHSACLDTHTMWMKTNNNLKKEGSLQPGQHSPAVALQFLGCQTFELPPGGWGRTA